MIDSIENKAIRSALSNLSRDLITSIHEKVYPESSLISGKMGMYLFLHSKYVKNDFSEFEQRFNQDLQKVLATPKPSYADGITGVGYMLKLLVDEEILNYDQVSDLLSDIDDYSGKMAMLYLEKSDHDFLYGGLGEMLYLAKRLKYNEKVFSFLERAIVLLNNCSSENKDGIFWYELDYMKSESQLEKDCINMGIAHGQASKIILLAICMRLKVSEPRTSKLLQKSVAFALNQKSNDTRSFFPSLIEDGTRNDSEIWWSYGDLGMGLAFWLAGESLSDDKLKEDALKIFRHYSNYKIEDTKVYEPSFCRGTAGIAMMFHQMFINTQDNTFRQATNYWNQETLKMAKEVDGKIYFEFYNSSPEDSKTRVWGENHNLLMGSAGVGLSLLSLLKEQSINWGSVFLLN